MELANPAIGTLLQNIEKLRCGDDCHIHRRRAELYLKQTEESYDVIFLDPPYNKGLVDKCLETIFGSSVLRPDGIVIAEHSPREEIDARFSSLITDHKKRQDYLFYGVCPTN